jgi:hypothetical protein
MQQPLPQQLHETAGGGEARSSRDAWRGAVRVCKRVP